MLPIIALIFIVAIGVATLYAVVNWGRGKDCRPRLATVSVFVALLVLAFLTEGPLEDLWLGRALRMVLYLPRELLGGVVESTGDVVSTSAILWGVFTLFLTAVYLYLLASATVYLLDRGRRSFE